MISSLSLSQRYALVATLRADRHMLIRQGKHYSTHFVGGARVKNSTVESLIVGGLMQRVQGGPSVTLTRAGISIARQEKLEADQAEAAARARTAHTNAKYARRTGWTQRAIQPVVDLIGGDQPARRLPYADN